MQHATTTLRVRIAKVTDELGWAERRRAALTKELRDVEGEIARAREAITDLHEALAVLDPTDLSASRELPR